MSALNSDYRDLLRQVLSCLYEEIGGFYKEHAIDQPSIDSKFAKERADSRSPESLVIAWSIATTLVESGGEHLMAFVSTITEPMNAIASWTCVRSMLEPCALACWLIDPRIDCHTRVQRVFSIRYEGQEQYLKYARSSGATDQELREINGKKNEVECKAKSLGYKAIRDRKGKHVIGLGERLPGATEIIRHMFDEEPVYRLLSAVTHGHTWAIRTLSYCEDSSVQGQADIFGINVAQFVKKVDPKNLALLGLVAIKSFTKPVWYKCNYAGWDKEALTAIFENTFDKLSINERERFWRSP